jgi:hypothetical protein
MRLPRPEFTMTDMWKRPTTRTDQQTPESLSSGPVQRSHERTSTKGVILSKQWLTSVTAAVAVAAVCTGSAFAGTAKSAKIVLFTGNYAGTANVTVADDVSNIQASGPGKGTPVGIKVPPFGLGKVTGLGTGSADKTQTCQVFNGTGSITGIKGAKLNFKMTGAQACGDADGENFSIVGRATVTGGAGAYKRAKGSLKVTGLFKKSAKTFAIKFSGKLTI